MATDMRKTPSYLKGLAEDRARADGDTIRLQHMLDELAPEVAKAERMLSLHEDILAQHNVARTKRDACDTLIRSFDSRLDPAQPRLHSPEFCSYSLSSHGFAAAEAFPCIVSAYRLASTSTLILSSVPARYRKFEQRVL